MAKNTGKGYRKGAVKGRSQTTKSNTPTKRGSDGKFMDKKSDSKPFKGVRKEK